MSFDTVSENLVTVTLSVSIPFEQGDVFRQSTKKQFDKSILCLNPFRAGRCLSTRNSFINALNHISLNPFRAGRCLSTIRSVATGIATSVSIPFEQGDVFRPKADMPKRISYAMSQSLSSRAMSFDERNS